MPQLFPFHAVRFLPPPDGNIGPKIAPPYDVLDEVPKQQLLERDPHNVVAIDLPVTPPKTVGPDAAYEQAASAYRHWLSEGVLRRDERPAIYAYQQRWTRDGEIQRRRGMLALLALEPFGRRGGGIHRHELTIQSGMDDRLKLMTATAAQLSPVFTVYHDTDRRAAMLLDAHFAQRAADFHGLTTNDNVTHECWMITDQPTIDGLTEVLHDADVFIADGHHRYHTALNYHNAHPDNPAAGRCLFMLAAAEDPGVNVLPTHRVLCELADFSIKRLTEVLDSDGRFRIAPTYNGADGLPHMPQELANLGHHAFGLYDPATGKTWAVSSVEPDPLATVLPDKAAPWRALDVAVFHELFVDRLIRPHFGGDAIRYLYPHEPIDLVRLSHDAAGRLGVIMQATPLQAVCDVALAGEVMPPKSTFFFPKVATGLVINPLD